MKDQKKVKAVGESDSFTPFVLKPLLSCEHSSKAPYLRGEETLRGVETVPIVFTQSALIPPISNSSLLTSAGCTGHDTSLPYSACLRSGVEWLVFRIRGICTKTSRNYTPVILLNAILLNTDILMGGSNWHLPIQNPSLSICFGRHSFDKYFLNLYHVAKHCFRLITLSLGLFLKRNKVSPAL